MGGDVEMNFEQLRYIIKIAKYGSLIEAAKSLHITQSALSQAITKVERELNVKIFNRTRSGTTPTEVGEKIIQQAKIILEQFQKLKNISNPNQIKELCIGAIPDSINCLPNTLTTIKRKHPNTLIELDE